MEKSRELKSPQLTQPTKEVITIEREEGERVNKVLSRYGICSRRRSEVLIKEGRVTVNGTRLTSPAFFVSNRDVIAVDGKNLRIEPTKLWMHNKKRGVLVTHSDPANRTCLFKELSRMGVPPCISVGRLGYSSEGLLLLTNDGRLARYLEHPSSGFERKYRILVYGNITEDKLKALTRGFSVEGTQYPPLHPVLGDTLDKETWMEVTVNARVNIKNMLQQLHLKVSRITRISYGPYSLHKLASGSVLEVPIKEPLKQFLNQHKDSALDRIPLHSTQPQVINTTLIDLLH